MIKCFQNVHHHELNPITSRLSLVGSRTIAGIVICIVIDVDCREGDATSLVGAFLASFLSRKGNWSDTNYDKYNESN